MSEKLEKLNLAWAKLRNSPDTSVTSICSKMGLDGGDEALLLTARFEQRILKAAFLLHMEVEVGGQTRPDGANLMLEFKHQYDAFDIEEKFGIIPLFYDLEMKQRKSQYMKQELVDLYYPCFVDCLAEDEIAEETLKAEFLASGYNKLMPFIHMVDEDYKAQKR